MFAAQRIKLIKEVMLKDKNVDIATLCSLLDVSDVTVRKDLDKLEQEGFLIKTHGGAVLVESQEEDLGKDVSIVNFEAKEKVADLASNVIEDGDSIFLGPGSTCYLLAKKLKEKKAITLITNSVNVLNELAPFVKNIYLVGGQTIYDEGMIYTTGQPAVDYLKGIYVNRCIVGVDGIDMMAGFTVNDLSLSIIIREITRNAKHVIFLADHTKFNKIGSYQVAPINFPNCVVSNDRLDNTYKQYFYENDIKILTAFDL